MHGRRVECMILSVIEWSQRESIIKVQARSHPYFRVKPSVGVWVWCEIIICGGKRNNILSDMFPAFMSSPARYHTPLVVTEPPGCTALAPGS